MAITVERKRGRIQKPLRRPDLLAIGQIGVDGIVRGARSGRGADGSRLKPRADGSPSRLTSSGRLLASVRVLEVDGNEVTFGPDGVSYAAEVNAERPFAGWHPDALEQARRKMAESFRANVALSDHRNASMAKAVKSDDRSTDAEDA